VDLAASDASGANADSSGLAFYEGSDCLKIRPEKTFRDTMGMADLIPDHFFLSTHKTRGCHFDILQVSLENSIFVYYRKLCSKAIPLKLFSLRKSFRFPDNPSPGCYNGKEPRALGNQPKMTFEQDEHS